MSSSGMYQYYGVSYVLRTLPCCSSILSSSGYECHSTWPITTVGEMKNKTHMVMTLYEQALVMYLDGEEVTYLTTFVSFCPPVFLMSRIKSQIESTLNG
jgi:hypothetical protein